MVSSACPCLALTYVSSATSLLQPVDLVALLGQARTANQDRGITGMLLYRDGNIIQVLEGEEDAVERTFSRISVDQRHRGVLVLQREQQPRRFFAQWSMGFRDVAGAAYGVEGYSRFLTEPVFRGLGDAAPAAAALLALFRDTMR